MTKHRLSMAAIAVAVLSLAACAGNTPTERAIIFGADLLTPAEQRCAEAQEIAADLDTPEAYALAAVACLP